MTLRVIGGEFKGKKLLTVRGTLTRPTSDKIREAIFNILSSSVNINKAVILDLFAGTGAFGIEALSRGAQSAVFIEKNRAPLSIIEKNIKSCSLETRSKIIKWDIVDSLRCLRSVKAPFNLVFMDPPYSRNTITRSLLNLYKTKSLADEAVIVVEHSVSEPIADDIFEYRIADQRKYGDTVVSFLHYNINCERIADE